MSIWEDSKKAENIRFEILTPAGAANPFAIQNVRRENGKLKAELAAVERLDRESVPKYTVSLESVDAAGNTVNTFEVIITVRDVNDHTPIIDTTTLYMEMPENAQVLFF